MVTTSPCTSSVHPASFIVVTAARDRSVATSCHCWLSGTNSVDRPNRQQIAAMENGHTISDPLNLGEQMRAEQHGASLLFLLENELTDLHGAEGVETVRRLIQNQ